MLNTLIPKGSAALGQAQLSVLETKNQRHKVLSVSGKRFSKAEFLFLFSNLEAQSLDIQYCKKKK